MRLNQSRVSSVSRPNDHLVNSAHLLHDTTCNREDTVQCAAAVPSHILLSRTMRRVTAVARERFTFLPLC